MKEEDIYKALQDPGPEGSPDEQAEPDTISIKVYEQMMNPSFLGEIHTPDGYAHLQGDCGDSMEVFLAIQDRRIREARFDTLGCGFSIACGNMAMEMAEGSTLSEAMRITPQQIDKALDGLPDSHFHCAELASEVLKKAVNDYLIRGKDEWKKMYRNR